MQIVELCLYLYVDHNTTEAYLNTIEDSKTFCLIIVIIIQVIYV